MLNQCILTGNLGDDPSSHYTPEGLAITHFNIAFKSSAKKKEANWIKVSCFGKLAEVASTYLHKGARIAVVGILDQNKWQGMMDRPGAPSRSSPTPLNSSRPMDGDSRMEKRLPMTNVPF